MKLQTDTYTLYARFFPAFITAVPLFTLWYFVAKDSKWNNLLHFILSLQFLGSLSISVVFLYFYSQLIRVTAKHFERRYFAMRRGFPSTYFMLYSDPNFSTDYKNKFREKVARTLRLDLLSAVEENAEPAEAGKRLNEAFNHIRLKIGRGKLVLKHNIWYGFFRNLIGGSVYAVCFCVGNIFLGWKIIADDVLVIASTVLLVVYLGILAFHKQILVQNGEAYARQLISEFMALGRAK